MSIRAYKKLQWNAICDVCGKKFKSSKLLKRWGGLIVCKQDYEPRHPQDFVRGRQDTQTPPWSRTESTDEFITISIFSEYGVGEYG